MTKRAHDSFFATLANVNCLRIISALIKKRLCVNEMAVKTGLNQTTVSHNLRKMLKCGFVSVEQEGKRRYYLINKETMKPLLKLIEKHVREC